MAYSTISKPGLHFNNKLYTGTGSSNALTGVGFQPDWTWIKRRNSAGDHELYDAVRGVTKALYSNGNSGEYTHTNGLTAFGTDGFTVGSGGSVNNNSDTFASWNWKANGQGSSNTDGSINTTYTSVNSTAGFSISTYTGTGSNATFGHGLGVKPAMFIIKRLSGTEDWAVYHQGLGASYYQNMNTNAAQQSNNRWNGEPDTSVIKLQSHAAVNGNGDTYVCYAFAEKKGYSAFGKYRGNANANGPLIYTGFSPAFVLIKETTDVGAWRIYDNKRGLAGDNIGGNYKNALMADVNSAEESGATNNIIDFLSTGFKCRFTYNDTNGNAGVYVYWAFAAEPIVANVGADGTPATAV